MKRLIIVGAGGHGRSVAEIVVASTQYELIGFVDDAVDKAAVWDFPVLAATAALADCRTHAQAAIVAIGNNRLREELHRRLLAADFELTTVVHPRAVVSPRAVLGVGCAIMSSAVIGTEARLGEGVIINSAAIVDHHCVVEDFGHVGTNAAMAGGSVLGRAAWMQAGSSLGYGVRVPPGAVLEPGEGRGANCSW